MRRKVSAAPFGCHLANPPVSFAIRDSNFNAEFLAGVRADAQFSTAWFPG